MVVLDLINTIVWLVHYVVLDITIEVFPLTGKEYIVIYIEQA